MTGSNENDKTRSLLERDMLSPERTPELFVKPMDRIRRAMALRRAHEETDAVVRDERDLQTAQRPRAKRTEP